MQTMREFLLSIVLDNTLGDNLHFMGNVPRFSFHDNSDTDYEALLNVDGNESLKSYADRNQELCKESDQVQGKLANSLATTESKSVIFGRKIQDLEPYVQKLLK